MNISLVESGLIFLCIGNKNCQFHPIIYDKARLFNMGFPNSLFTFPAASILPNFRKRESPITGFQINVSVDSGRFKHLLGNVSANFHYFEKEIAQVSRKSKFCQ